MARLIKQLLVMPSLYTNIKEFCCIEVSMKRQTFWGEFLYYFKQVGGSSGYSIEERRT